MSETEKTGDDGNLPMVGPEGEKLERAIAHDKPSPSAPPPTPTLAQPPVSSAPPAVPPDTKQASVASAGSTAYVFVGPGVKITGDIIGCDMLRVEGTVEGATETRQLVVCAGGSFVGTAEIENAEIEGEFDGTLNVGGKILLRSGGCVSGTLSYTEIEVERGGKLVGEVGLYQVQKTPASAAANLQLVANEKRKSTASPTPSALGPAGAASRAPSQPPPPASAVSQPGPRAALLAKATQHAMLGPQPNAPQSAPTSAQQRLNALQSTDPQAPPQDAGALEPKTLKGLFFGRG
jgi:cytoskeletal protein CcmA (bactofilin family)